ncbi:PEGA domain-containing protein [Acidobacteriota bacterium]
MKHKDFCFVIIICVLFSLLGYGQESQESQESQVPIRLKVVVDEARVNETPDISGATLAKLVLNTLLVADAKEGEWYKVSIEIEGVKISGYMHEMLAEVATEEEIAEEGDSPEVYEESQEDLLLDIETAMNENRDLIRQNKQLEDAILSLNPLLAKAFKVTDDKRQKELAAEIFLWIGLGYAGQNQVKRALNEFRNMFEVEFNYAKEITRNIYDPKIVSLIQHSEKAFLGEQTIYSIEIETIPDGANIKLNGMEVGVSSGVFQIDSPVVRIEIEKEGYAPLSDEVLVSQDTPQKQYELEALGHDVLVKTEPAGAKVYLDGKDTGKMTPCTLPLVPYGNHQVKVEKENYLEWEEGITVEKNDETYALDVALIASAYQFLNKWGGPNSPVFKKPMAIAMDKDSNVYVLDDDKEKIKKFDPDGKPLRGWKLHGQRYKGIKIPSDLAIDSEGYIYVTDVKEHCVWKFNHKGSFINKWGKEGNQREEFLRPTGIAVNDQNQIFVIDSGNSRVKIYSSTGALSDVWEKPGDIASPIGIVFSANNEVFILDRLKAYIFSSEGELVLSWGKPGTNAGEFRSPSGISVDFHNYLYVADTLNHRIQKFDSKGNFVTEWGSTGLADGQFNSPKDVVVDNRGFVYVVDSGNNRVQVFSVPSPVDE